MLKVPKKKKAAKKAVVKKQQQLFPLMVSQRTCKGCELADVCSHKNTTDKTCRLTHLAGEEFLSHCESIPWINTKDMFGIRSLAGIYASIVLCELHLSKYGSTEEKKYRGKTRTVFTPMHDRYIAMNTTFQMQLTRYGLNPIGRKKFVGEHTPLNPMPNESVNELEEYLEAEYTVREPKRKSKHS